MTIERVSAGPACWEATSPLRTKMPAPITAPTPSVTSASGPSSRRSVPAPASASRVARSFLTKSDIEPPNWIRNCIQTAGSITGPRKARKNWHLRWGERYIGGIVPKRASSRSRPKSGGRRAGGATERANKLYDSLRNLIVRGQLAPGARIVETEVAERFGVSRTPVRAAFQRLEREGYVTASATHQARMTVAPLTREDVGELLEIVGELEGVAARSAAHLSEEERQAVAQDLAALNADFRKAASAKGAQPGKLYELDERFHRRYVEAGSGPRLLTPHEAGKPPDEPYLPR